MQSRIQVTLKKASSSWVLERELHPVVPKVVVTTAQKKQRALAVPMIVRHAAMQA